MKKKVQNATNYKRDLTRSAEFITKEGEILEQIGVTSPDKALTLEELINRFVQGRDVDIMPVITVPEGFDQIEQEFGVTLQKLSTMSKLEKAEFAHEVGKTIEQTRDNLQNLRRLTAEKQKQEQEQAKQIKDTESPPKATD